MALLIPSICVFRTCTDVMYRYINDRQCMQAPGYGACTCTCTSTIQTVNASLTDSTRICMSGVEWCSQVWCMWMWDVCTIIRGCGCVVRNVCVHSCLFCGGWGWGVWATGGSKGVRACMYVCMYVCIDQTHSNIYIFFLPFLFFFWVRSQNRGGKGIWHGFDIATNFQLFCCVHAWCVMYHVCM